MSRGAFSHDGPTNTKQPPSYVATNRSFMLVSHTAVSGFRWSLLSTGIFMVHISLYLASAAQTAVV